MYVKQFPYVRNLMVWLYLPYTTLLTDEETKFQRDYVTCACCNGNSAGQNPGLLTLKLMLFPLHQI